MTEDKGSIDKNHAGSRREADTSSPTISQSMLRAMIGLSLFAVVTAGLIAVTQLNTAERIQEQIKLARSKALLEIVPLADHNNDLLADSFWLDSAHELGLTEPAEAFVAKQDGVAVALILPVVAPDGYSGPIRLIVGINVNGTIKGVRVIEHKETPGLGDKISIKKSDWVLSFDGKSLINTRENAWRVKKDGGSFDQLTGATITPRAIVRAVHQALLFYQDRRSTLLAQTPLERSEKTRSVEIH